jgi:hypothetical protein
MTSRSMKSPDLTHPPVPELAQYIFGQGVGDGVDEGADGWVKALRILVESHIPSLGGGNSHESAPSRDWANKSTGVAILKKLTARRWSTPVWFGLSKTGSNLWPAKLFRMSTEHSYFKGRVTSE